MKKFRKFTLLLLVLLLTFSFSANINKKESLVVNAQGQNERMLKAVWVSRFVSDVTNINSEYAFKNSLTSVLDKLESYGYNALIFHVRIHNNALYPSAINPKSPYVSNINFNTFDPLEWLVEETHKRGMEFHAWMNPYRPAEGRYSGSMPSGNPESSSANLLTGSNGTTKILDPSKEVVKNHIKNTVKEVIENYDVDGIHFDDYFYIPYNGLSVIAKTNHVNDMIERVSTTIKNHNANNNKHVQFGISPTGIYKNGNGTVTYYDGKVYSSGSQTLGQQHGLDDLCADTLHWMNEGWIDYIMPQIYWERGHSHGDFLKVIKWWNDVASYLDVNLYVGLGLYMAGDSTTNWNNDTYELSAQITLIENYSHTVGYSLYSYQNMTSPQATKNQVDNAYSGSKSYRKDIRVLPEIKSMTPVVPSSVGHNHANGRLNWDYNSDAKFYYLFRSTGTVTYSDDEIFAVVDKNTTSYMTYDTANNYNYGVKVLSGTNHLSGQSVDDPSNTSYSITYNLNGGSFSGYNTKEEIITAFLTDLYAFVNPTENLNTFMHGAGKTSGFDGVWYSNETYKSKIYSINIKNNNNNYFLSHSQYQAKWEPLADFMEDFVKINPAQSFWGSFSTGTLRMWQYFTNNPPSGSWSNEDMAKIPEGLSQTILYAYDKNTATIILPTPEKSGNTFLGWYTNPAFSGSSVTTIPKGSTGDKFFYAKWQDDTPATYYSVSFNLGYSNLTLPTEQVREGNKVSQPTNPTRTGYTFVGWYEGSTLFDFGKPINKNTTLTAQWQQIEIPPTSYTVSFSLGYNNLTLPSQTVTSGAKASKPTDPTRSGYTFIGWYLNNNIYNFNNSVNSNINLVAGWEFIEEPDDVTVTFNNGYDNNTTKVTVTRGSKVTKPADPVREGYTFVRWNLGYDKFDFNTAINYSLTLTAQWKAENNNSNDYVTVIFDHNYDNIKVTEEVIRGTKVTKPADPVRAGYTFKGWYFVGSLYNFNDSVNYGISLIAQWQQNQTPPASYTVSFSLGYNNLTLPSQTVTSGAKANKPTDPTRSGYTFIGWYLNNNIYNFNNSVNSNITLVAGWEFIEEADDVTVTFNNGYDNNTTKVTVTRGSKVTKPADPVREGYTFVRWNLGYDEFNFNTAINYSLTLTAQWKAENNNSNDYVTVIFDHNYDNIKVTEEVIRGSKVNKPADPVREGYTFVRWNLGYDKFDFNTAINYSLTLTAQWQQNEVPPVSYIVNFNLGYNNLTLPNQTVTSGAKASKPTDPTRIGYNFLGWYLNEELYNFNLVVTKEITLIAKWEKESFIITFNLGNATETLDVLYKEMIKVPFTPNKEGYLFVGWYDGNNKYDFTSEVTKDLTLTAKWEEVKQLKDISIYGKTTVKVNGNNSKGLVYQGIKKAEYKKEEHGFYLVYGNTTNDELMNAINNNLLINNKKIIKVTVKGLKKEGVFSVVINGIPASNYDDVITVIPYVVIGGKITLATEGMVSSVNHATRQQTTSVIREEIAYVDLDWKKYYKGL